MKHYRQGLKRNCGQIAVASLTERTVEEVEAIVGHDHCTKTSELAEALRKLGYECAGRARPVNQLISWPDKALLQVRAAGRPGWHWVAYEKGMVCDGHGYGEPTSLREYETTVCLPNGRRITSLVEVSRPQVGPFGHCDAEWQEHLTLHEDSTECRNWRPDKKPAKVKLESRPQFRTEKEAEFAEAISPEGPLRRAHAVCHAFRERQITRLEFGERIAQERQACRDIEAYLMHDSLIHGTSTINAGATVGTSFVQQLLTSYRRSMVDHTALAHSCFLTSPPALYHAYVDPPSLSELSSAGTWPTFIAPPRRDSLFQTPRPEEQTRTESTVEQPAPKPPNPHSTEATTLGDKQQQS